MYRQLLVVLVSVPTLLPAISLCVTPTNTNRKTSTRLCLMERTNGRDYPRRHGRLASIVPPLVGDSSSAAETIPKESSYNHHLVVHFDINETILVGDEAGGDTRNDCLNKVLAKSAFVVMPNDDEGKTSWDETQKMVPTHWWDGTPISTTTATAAATTTTKENGDTNKFPPPLYVGWTWPKGCCAYYRTSFKKKAKTFVEHDGKPYRETFDYMQEKLQHGGDASSSDSLPPILHNMLPAFFRTLIHLSQTQQKKTIVFRTFGTDLSDVAEAVTIFAQGKHPDYPDFCNPDWVMPTDSIVKGRWLANDDGIVVYQLFRDDHCIAGGDVEVLEFIHSHAICGIQDDYPFWNAHGEEPWAGKPVWKLDNVHHVLLDDNIHNLPTDSIACVRQRLLSSDANDHGDMFRTLTGPELLQEQGRHLIRVPTIAPILHDNWFLEMIEKSQASFVQETQVT